MLVFVLINQKIFSFFKEKIGEKTKKNISIKIIDYLKSQNKFIPDRSFSHSSELLDVMEIFNYRLKEEGWDRLKREIVECCLLKKIKV